MHGESSVCYIASQMTRFGPVWLQQLLTITVIMLLSQETQLLLTNCMMHVDSLETKHKLWKLASTVVGINRGEL